MKKYKISEINGEKVINFTYSTYKMFLIFGVIFVLFIISSSFLSSSQITVNGQVSNMEPSTRVLWLVIMFSVSAIIVLLDVSSLDATVTVKQDGSLVVYRRKWLFVQKKYELESGLKYRLIARSMFLWKMYSLSVQYELNGKTQTIFVTPSRTRLYLTRSGWGLTLNEKEVNEISQHLNLPIEIV